VFADRNSDMADMMRYTCLYSLGLCACVFVQVYPAFCINVWFIPLFCCAFRTRKNTCVWHRVNRLLL